MTVELPTWVKREESYNPGTDRDYFISRSLLRLFSVLASLRNQGCRRTNPPNAVIALIFTFTLSILSVSSRTPLFLWGVLAGELVCLCSLPGNVLRDHLRTALATAVISALIVAPALFLGNGRYVLLLPYKTFLTVTLLLTLREYTPWNKLTAALQAFHLPVLVIFIFDTTLRFIALLGDQAATLLTALKLRSVGHNPAKLPALGGVMGVVLQKSAGLSQDTYDAMRCRCFTGTYLHGKEKRTNPGWRDLILLLSLSGYLYLFIRTEGVLL